MAYTKQTWVDGTSKLNATRMNYLESGVEAAATAADTGVTNAASAQTTASAAIPKSTVTAAGDLIYATGNAAVTRLAKGSDGTYLKLASGVPSWAALAVPTVTYASTPPSSPVDGDIWFYVTATADSTICWQFRYNSTNTTYKWEFVGGAPAFVGATDVTVTGGGASTGVSFTIPRAGDYIQIVSAYSNMYGGQSYSIQCSDGTTHNTVALDSDAAGTDRSRPLGGSYKWTGKSASTVLSMRGTSSGAGNVTFSKSTNQVIPVRVS